MIDLATHRWDRSTWVVLRDGVRRDPATGRWMTTKGTKMTDDWQPMETARRHDDTMTDLQVVYLDPGWLRADVKRVKRRATFRRWCISLTDDEITAVVRFITERRAAMTTATWINHNS